MTTDLLFSLLMVLFVVFGAMRPHIALAGVVWVDTITPQQISTSFLAGKPLSLVITLFFFVSVIVNLDKVRLPARKAPLVLLGLLIFWMWVSTQLAHHPDMAQWKFGVVFKILLLASFIPLVLDDRKKIESFLWIFVASVGFYLHTAGIKAAAGGGGYGVDVIRTSAENSGITETSTLSIMAAVVMPLIAYLYRYSSLSTGSFLVKSYLLGTFVAAIFAIIGTFARSGLVTCAFVALMFVFVSRRKMRILLFCVAGVFLLLPYIPSGWVDRMSTITTASQDESALGRMVVWKWTLDYAAEYPFFGGGFFAYLDNAGRLEQYEVGSERLEGVTAAKAFHNVFFEVLGELGYGGLIIYIAFIFTSIRSYWRLRGAHENADWFDYLARMLIIATLAYFVGGMFVAIAYQSWIYYLLFVGVSMASVPASRRVS